MSNTSKITLGGLKKYDEQLVEKRLGNLDNLTTENKETFVGAINDVVSTVSDLKDTVDANTEAASDANNAAGAAQTTANEAKSAAGAAQTTADEAKSAAGAAQTTADEAKSAAAAAQTTANEAKNNAQSALTKIGETELATTADTLTAAINEVNSVATQARSLGSDAYNKAENAHGMAQSALTKIGEAELSTTADTLTAAINEVFAAVGTGGTAAVVGVKESTSTDYAKVYTITQGGSTVGTINIPKDMVVSSGSVVTLAANEVSGLEAGTYIKLVLANSGNPLYINAKDLVDVYSAATNATQVQLTVSTDNVISAALVAGGVGTTELANNAVTRDKISASAVNAAKLANDSVTTDKILDSAVSTDKIANSAVSTDKIANSAIKTSKIADSAITTVTIADKNVTKDKLADAVQTSLGKADTAVQPDDIAGIATNATNISNLTTRVSTLENDVATDDEILALFN